MRQIRPFELLVTTVFSIAVVVQTLGRIPGSLPILASLCALPLLFAVVYSILRFASALRSEVGPAWAGVFIGVTVVQAFWAFFRAPLDVDGIFYHLPIALEALQQKTWGHWQVLSWQVQSTPKISEIPSLCLIALGGPYGYRLAQFGHFASAMIGAWAFADIAKTAKLPRSSLFGLVYFLTPIVTKQMTANYVDMAFYSFWLGCAAFAARLAFGASRSSRDWTLLGISAFLLVGSKMNGFISLAAISPFLFFCRPTSKAERKPFFVGMGVFVLFVIASASLWMIPNLHAFGNPLFPLNPGALIHGNGAKIIPDEIPVTGLNGWVGRLNAPAPIRWFLQFFAFEPIAQYDMCGGAWGFVGAWAILVLVFFSAVPARRKAFKVFKNPTHFAFLTSLFLAFALTPGRIVPRYALVAGFLFIYPALVLLVNRDFPRFLRGAFVLAVAIQIPYILMERVLVRGVGSDGKSALSVIAENFRDVVIYGEPQAAGRWMHFPYVPELRRNEPRDVTVGADCVDLVALYWGRHFSNRVHFTPECRRWPYR